MASVKGLSFTFSELGIAILRMKRGQNRINIEFIEAFNECLDKIEQKSDCRGLLTTGEGKFYSNGLDLDWLSKQNTEGRNNFKLAFNSLFTRLLTFPIPTIAAINGHAYAGGALLALAHDFRVMNSEKGWFCMNEVHINLRLSTFFLALLRAKISTKIVEHRLLVFGHNYTAKEAVEAALVDRATSAALLESESLRYLERWIGKNGFQRDSLHNMKQDVYADVVKLVNASKL
ncbi:enoyl-CoA delta isomerase 2, peroxisomal-like [Pomacea canaliculata]|uniref:enoyl-CoA delta isomerase 2, peroxisomal-like n=1 Tax=Pomacea canaliculata TaxID=400727 RepID=UPI000D735F6D|nr:enoyl-CoA delta isomerase 2, peroxisomal-like [Pomacea canaliculata]